MDIPLWKFLIINVSRDISQSISKSQYVGSPSYHHHHIISSRNNPIQFQIKYMDLPLWTFLSKNISQSRKQQRGNDPIQFPIQYKYIPLWTFFIINMSRDVSQSNSESQYVGSSSYHYLDIKWHPRNNPIQVLIKYMGLPLSTFFTCVWT